MLKTSISHNHLIVKKKLENADVNIIKRIIESIKDLFEWLDIDPDLAAEVFRRVYR